MEKQFLWVEEYRPRVIDHCVLPKSLKKYFTDIVKKGDLQNMLFSGPAGSGKTTVARALCEELECDYIIINGSEESGIDVLRTKIKSFASTVSFTGNTKVVILDETDSGLDIDALKDVAKAINYFKSKDKIILMITHYQRLLDYIIPDHVHVLSEGKIIKSGPKELALELEEKGYEWLVGV